MSPSVCTGARHAWSLTFYCGQPCKSLLFPRHAALNMSIRPGVARHAEGSHVVYCSITREKADACHEEKLHLLCDARWVHARSPWWPFHQRKCLISAAAALFNLSRNIHSLANPTAVGCPLMWQSLACRWTFVQCIATALPKRTVTMLPKLFL